MKWDPQVVADLKERHGEIFDGTIGDVRFLWRRPKWNDAEMFSQAAKKSALSASRQLIGAVIVHPDKAETLAALKELPLAVMAYVDGFVCPLLGLGAAMESKPL